MTYSIFLQISSSEFYELPNFKSLQFKHNSPVSPMPIPEESSEYNTLVKIEGNSQTVSLDWLLTYINDIPFGETISYDSGNKKWKITGTAESYSPISLVRTLKQKSPVSITDVDYRILIFDNEINGGSITAERVKDVRTYDSSGLVLQMSGTWQSIEFTVSMDNPVNFDCHLDFIEGLNITSIEGSTPLRPFLHDVITDENNSIKITFDETEYSKNEIRPTVIAINVRYKNKTDWWWKTSRKVVADNGNGYNWVEEKIIDIPAGTYNHWQVALEAFSGLGQWSSIIEKNVTVSNI